MNRNVVLIGMPGCGKSAIGSLVANKLQLPFYDTDECIEKEEGKSIKDIFKYGEDHFRAIESAAVKKLSKNCPSVISTGGGVVKIAENMKVLRDNSIIIFLNRPLENIFKDVDISSRPLLAAGVSKLYELYMERYPLYKKYCDFEITNDTHIQDVADRIVKCVEDNRLS